MPDNKIMEDIESRPEYLDEEDSVPESIPGSEEESVAAQLAAHPINTQLVFPATGLYSISPPSRHWGIRQTIDAIKEIGSTWHQRHGNIRVGIGDISKQGGGPLPGHASHRKGIDADIRILRKDHAEQPTKWQETTYSRELTLELIDIILANNTLGVQVIFFNDPDILRERPKVHHWPNHDNHPHVRFQMPA